MFKKAEDKEKRITNLTILKLRIIKVHYRSLKYTIDNVKLHAAKWEKVFVAHIFYMGPHPEYRETVYRIIKGRQAGNHLKIWDHARIEIHKRENPNDNKHMKKR